MTAALDMSEVRSLARHLRRAEARLTPELEVLLSGTAAAVAATGRANAMADAKEPRPWLGTEQGIVVRRERLARTIVSPRDPRGQSVGYRVEYGTSEVAPRPFLGPAMQQGRESFNQAALALLVKATL